MCVRVCVGGGGEVGSRPVQPSSSRFNWTVTYNGTVYGKSLRYIIIGSVDCVTSYDFNVT